jgi:soluble lytic murein transglycosylase
MSALIAIGALLVAWTPWMAAGPAEPPQVVEDDPALGPAVGDAQLSPYFTTPALKSALSELQAGRPENALTFLPPAPKDGPTKWLKALVLRAADQPGPARKLFEQLAAGPLADRALHLAALCAIEQGDGAAAERHLGQVSLRYVDADQVLLEWARQYSRSHVAGSRTAERVEEILRPVFSGQVRTDAAPAHLIAGDAQAAAGEKEKARAHFRAAWVDRPLSAASESARGRERLLGPGALVPPEKLVRRAEILLEAHRNREAVDQLLRIPLPSLCLGGCPGDRTPAGFLQAAINALAPDALPVQHEPTAEDVAKNPAQPADPLACRAKLDQGRAYRKEHEYAKARAALGPVVLRCADPDIRARGLYLLAQLETIGGRATAGSLWEALARKFPRSYLADDALFNQSVALRRAGDAQGERALLRRLVDEHLDSDLLSEAIFRLFWSFYAEGKGRQGLVYLDQLAARPDPEGAEEERARYWRARVLLDPQADESELSRAAAREAAREDLIWLVQERPLTYHSLLARGRLAEMDPERARQIEAEQTQQIAAALAQAGKFTFHAGALARDPHLAAAIELLRMGLRQEASRELTAVDRSFARNAGAAGQEPLALIAQLYARAGDFRNAHALMRTDLRMLLRRPASPLALRAAALAYPLAFREQISRASQTSAIPADLLQALMREESALDPRALSPTGALGLTQVMPATARMVARRLKIRGYQTERLLDPDTNIRIGGAYLGELYARFQHPALALASYNAGPGTVAGWIKARGSLPLDQFVEEIPLEETRGYVKRCLRSFAAYQFLYDSGRGMPKVLQGLARGDAPLF